MMYTTIVKYVRDGDFVTPVRVSEFNHSRKGGVICAEGHARRLDWAELYGNHTSWVAEQVNNRGRGSYVKPAQMSASPA